MGFSLKKRFRKIVGNKIANTVSKVVNTKNLAYAAPYTSVFSRGGREALRSTYGAIGSGIVRQYAGAAGGDAAGAFAGAAFDSAVDFAAPIQRERPLPLSGDAFTNPGQPESSGMSTEMMIGIAVAGVVVLYLVMRK